MRKKLSVWLFVGCLCLSSSAIFAQPAKRRNAAPKPLATQTKVDLGKLENNTYTNNFFALKFEFPLGWLVGDNMLEAQLMQLTNGGIQAKNSQNQSALNQAINRVTPLLGGYKSLPGSPENSSLRVVVENIKTPAQIKNGKDYLGNLLFTLKATQLPAGFEVSEIKSETVNNISLDYLETSFGKSRKRAYALIRKGYAVLMTIESYDDADFDALHKVLLDADLDYKS